MIWLVRIVYDHTLGPEQPQYINNGSNLTLVGVVPGAIAWVKLRNCREKRCWRIGFHKVDGTKYKTCHRHATIEVHDRLHSEHAVKHPEQHKLLNRRETA